jgi:hypothetical protein
MLNPFSFWMRVAAITLSGLFGVIVIVPHGDAAGSKTGAARSRQGAMPAALIGKWGFAVASGVYCNTIGICAPGSGGSISFTFGANGRTEFALFESSLIDGCGQVQTLTLKTGTTTVKGAQLIFAPKAGTYKSVNGCRPDLTGTWTFAAKDLKPMQLEWHLLAGGLRISDPNGEVSGVYSRR